VGAERMVMVECSAFRTSIGDRSHSRQQRRHENTRLTNDDERRTTRLECAARDACTCKRVAESMACVRRCAAVTRSVSPPCVCRKERLCCWRMQLVGVEKMKKKYVGTAAQYRARSGVCVISVLERPICAVNLFSVVVVCVVFCGVWWYPVRWALFFGLVVHR
jgi:hypothetical protein